MKFSKDLFVNKQLELYVISTPIGNLQDITFRAVNTLKKLDLILVESKKYYIRLKNFYKLPDVKFFIYRESTHSRILVKILDFVYKTGKDVTKIGLISDAGTPLVADPGLKLIKELREKINYIKIIPIPGVSSVITAFSIYSNATSPRFLFMGFWPRRLYKGIKIIDNLKDYLVKYKITLIFFVPKHDLIKILEHLDILAQKYIKFNIKLLLGLAKELTKINENIFEGTPDSILKQLKNKKELLNGEFTLLLTLQI